MPNGRLPAQLGVTPKVNAILLDTFASRSPRKANGIIEVFWSGRWESNPRPNTKLRKIPVDAIGLTHRHPLNLSLLENSGGDYDLSLLG